MKNKLGAPIGRNNIWEIIEGINAIDKTIYKFFYFESNSRDIVAYFY